MVSIGIPLGNIIKGIISSAGSLVFMYIFVYGAI
jgi:hypothetical protein